MPIDTEQVKLGYIHCVTYGVGDSRGYTVWIARRYPKLHRSEHRRYSAREPSVDRLVYIVKQLQRKGVLEVEPTIHGWIAYRVDPA